MTSPELHHGLVVNRRTPGLSQADETRWRCSHRGADDAQCQFTVTQDGQPPRHTRHPDSPMVPLSFRTGGKPVR